MKLQRTGDRLRRISLVCSSAAVRGAKAVVVLLKDKRCARSVLKAVCGNCERRKDACQVILYGYRGFMGASTAVGKLFHVNFIPYMKRKDNIWKTACSECSPPAVSYEGSPFGNLRPITAFSHCSLSLANSRIP